MSTDTSQLDFEISSRPDFALLTVNLRTDESVLAEPGAMASRDPSVVQTSGFKGGLGRTLGRAFGGESLIMNTFTAEDEPGEVTFAAGPMGDIQHYYLDGGALFLQRGAFVACSEGVEISGSWQGARGFFSGEGLVLLKATGRGDVFFNSYGAILEQDVTGGYVVDTGYIVAFEDTLEYRVSILKGLRGGGTLKSLFFGGEGLVAKFSGQGRVWIQTRYVSPFLSFVHPFRPTKRN